MPAWSLTAESAEERVCVLMNHSVVEIDMFRLKCEPQPKPKKPQAPKNPKPNQGPNQTQPRPQHFFRLVRSLTLPPLLASFQASL